MLRSPHALALLSFLASCGGEPPPAVVKPPPLVVAVKPAPPPPMRARWVFSHPERGLLAKLDLGDAGTLYAGQNGRREIIKGDAPPMDAQTLALDDLAGILRDDKGQYAFVATDGDVYVSKEPLGSLDVVRPGPLEATESLKSPTTGRSSILGIRSGGLIRSADYGVSWKPVDYTAGNKTYGNAVSVQLDAKGNGILLHLPQRLYVTHDDGATWSPVTSATSPGIGGKLVLKDGIGGVHLLGWGGQHAKLDGNNLTLSTDPLLPLIPQVATSQPPVATSGSERTETKSLLAGDRVIELTAVVRHGKTRAIEVSSAALGEKPDQPVPSTDLVQASGLSHLIAAYGSDVLYGRMDDDADEDAPTTTLFRSGNYGQSWQKESTLPGTQPTDEALSMALGPKGWSYVDALCPRYQRGSDKCGHRQIRPAGASAYEDMESVEEFSPEAFAFDETRSMVYAIGRRDYSHRYVYSSPLNQNKFTRTAIPDLGVPGGASQRQVAIAVDAQGILRVLSWDQGYRGESDQMQQWALHRLATDGKEMPLLYLPLPDATVSLAGGRGLIFAGHEKGWETADGGETWIRVATNGWGADLMCGEPGCVAGDSVRLGWDLPALQSLATDKVLATTEPTKATSGPTRPSMPPAPAPLDLTCKPSGGASGVAAFPTIETVDNRPDAQWAAMKYDYTDQKRSIVVGGRAGVRELAMLGPQPKPAVTKPGVPQPAVPAMEYRTGDRPVTGGIVTARFSFKPSQPGSYNPVDVDLAWWSATTGRVTHRLLPKVKPFRVSRYGFAGTPQVVTGGLLYQSDESEPVMYIHDDGKVETLTIPSRSTIRNSERVAKRWLLGDWDGGNAQVAWSDDDGKTWKTRAWGLAEDGSSLGLTISGGKGAISVTHGGNIPGLFFPVDTVVPDDPPSPIVVDPTAPADTPCDATQGTMRATLDIPYDKRTVKASVETPDGATKKTAVLTATNRVVHDLPNGRLCTSAYQLSGYVSGSYYDSETAFLYPEAKGGWAGWRFRHAPPDPKDKTKPTLLAEPISCK